MHEFLPLNRHGARIKYSLLWLLEEILKPRRVLTYYYRIVER